MERLGDERGTSEESSATTSTARQTTGITRRRSWRRAGNPTAPQRRSPAPTTAASAASSARLIEEDLKAGRLPAVVATSSLELGIDMGAVDLVIQVESPPSVASGLQRVGRAGHQVGAVSKGVIFPKYRGDLVQTAVVAERMRAGAHRGAVTSLATRSTCSPSRSWRWSRWTRWQVDDLLTLVRRAAPFASLPQSAYDAVLDMLAGRYPSDAFAELRPRIVWDRVTGELTARPGAQRLAVTSGGTIPDRGLFGVFLVGERQSRVGELDEEMVYESRVGDVFTLGSTSWRIEDITHDRVLVSPAPGSARDGCRSGRATPSAAPPSSARPSAPSSATTAALDDAAARERVQAAGLDAWAADNLTQLSARAATRPPGTSPTTARSSSSGSATSSATGGWSSTPPSAPRSTRRGRWRSRRDSGSASASTSRRCTPTTASSSGCRRATCSTTPPRPSRASSPSSPTRSSRSSPPRSAGRRCSPAGSASAPARALLLPRRQPDRRTPLWQQRQRAAQLLSVASEYGSFPIVLETMRECPAGRVRRARARPR